MSHPFRYDPNDPTRANWRSVKFPNHEFDAHSYDFNDFRLLLERQTKGIGDAVMSDGHIIEGGSIAVDYETALCAIEKTTIYIGGRVFTPPATSFSIDLETVVSVGVCIVETTITSDDDINLRGAIPGTRSDTEKGADRGNMVGQWVEESACAGVFFPVFTINNGVVITNTPPTELNPFGNLLAKYDREANGHYIVNGWKVTAMGLQGSDQHFSVADGVINVWGHKLIRDASQRMVVTENPVLEVVESEPHISAGGTESVAFNHPPVKNATQVTVTREVTETITRGQTPDGSDPLGQTSIVSLELVVQGGTTYTVTTDYVLTADQVDWSAGGIEPATGSTYDVTYRYIDTYVPDGADWDEADITITDAVVGTTILLEYQWALLRTDVIVIDRYGALKYVEGLSVRHSPLPPSVPNDLLQLCKIDNTWNGTPKVVNTATRAVHYNRMESLLNLFINLYSLAAQERLKTNATSRERVESRGLFVDPFFDDDLRDQGISQTLATVDEKLILPWTPTIEIFQLDATKMLDWTEELIIDQPLSTTQELINPYAAYDPLPATVTLAPAVDMWVETNESWTSSVSRTINGGTTQTGGSSVTEDIQELNTTQTEAEFLREITVSVTIQGFGAGEILDAATIDGVDVTPVAPQTADGSGDLTFDIDIPAGVPAGSKEVIVTGQGGTEGRTIFVGQGVIETRIMRRVFTTVVFRQQDMGGNGSGGDPQAQTWTLPVDGGGRMVSSINVKFTTIGSTSNPVICQIKETIAGVPHSVIVAESVLSMGAVAVDVWTKFNFANPVYIDPGVEHAMVFITDDNAHEIQIGELGGFDETNQQWVTSQAYTIGERLSSSNAMTWTTHPKSDLTFQVNAAKFSPLTKVVSVGTVTLVNCSDLIVDAPHEEPGLGTRVAVKVTMADATIYRMRLGQPLKFDEYKDEDITVELELIGDVNVSPIVYPFVQVIQSEIALTGNYQSRAVPAGTDSAVRVTFKASLPGSAGTVVEVGDGATWYTMTSPETVGHEDGYTEYRYLYSDYDLLDCRIRMTLSGTPAYRPNVKSLEMNVTPDPAQIV